MATAFAARCPSYPAILALDRAIRDLYVPPHLRPEASDDAPGNIVVQRWGVLSAKETCTSLLSSVRFMDTDIFRSPLSVLLHLHRAYFAQALSDAPDNLMHHKYTPSVLACYRSAWRLLAGFKCIRERAEAHFNRYNLAWSHVLSALVSGLQGWANQY